MIPYGIAIHPRNGDIYVTDAKNYVSSGVLHCYSREGVHKWSVRTGDIPAHMVFSNANRLGNEKIFAILLSALALGGCENDGIPYVSLGLDDLYKVARMQTVDLKPAFTGESYRWTVKTASGADSLLSEEKDYIFLMQYPGTYDVTFQIFDPVNPIVHRMTFYVVEEEVEYSPYISTVYEYCPAPGQFVNAMPEYREGDTAETMRQKAEEAIAGKMQSGVSLGAYGGYITFGFDHTVVNVPGEYDIRIDGNSFNSAAHPGVDGGSSEPGIIMVMFDENQNGKPDDKWYEIDKNPWYTDEAATYGYEITYHRPAPDHVPTPGEGNDSALTDMTYIKWEDNRGQTDYVYKNKFHDQDYYPKWIDADEMTFRGTLLPKNAVDVSGNGSYYLQYMFKYGAYADNYPNEAKDENGNYYNGFDIGWAVDPETREPVHLPGVDFIRVYTALNQYCGWIGETSTEIFMARDMHIYVRPDQHQ